MAICVTCGHDNPDGSWSCASCGQPLSSGTGGGGGAYEASEPVRDHDYYQAPTIYGTSAPTIPPPGSSRKSGDGPSLLKIVLIGGLLAVLAIVAVWFFFLRSDGGAAFVGEWKATDISQGIVRIEQSGGDMHIFFVDGRNGESTGPFKGEVKGDKLETRLEYAGTDVADQTTAEMYRGELGAVVDNALLVFSVSGDSLTMSVEGDLKNKLNPPADWGKPVGFTKVD
jgi:hypothetical protein